MRYGIFSDIHSNTEALDVVLALFKKEGVEKYLCLGDIVGYGAEPQECIAKIRALKPIVIGGNHDWGCVEMTPVEYFNTYAREALFWTKSRLNVEELNFLRSLESVHSFEEITLVHGSLDFPEEFHYIFDIESATSTLELLKTKICFVGHSHLPMVLSLDQEGTIHVHRGGKAELGKNERYLVNVGSVGQPRDGDPRASCAIYDSEKEIVEIKRVPYDIRATQQKIIQAGLPRVLATRLSEGR